MRNFFKLAAIELASLVCFPALAAVLTFHELVPAHRMGTGKLGLLLARARDQPVLICVLYFLVFSALARLGLKQLQRRGWLASRRPPVETVSQRRKALRSTIIFAVTVGVALLMRASVCEPYRVLSGSMLPTLEPGAWIFANKLRYGFRIPIAQQILLSRPLERGEVVAFLTPPGESAARYLVKRVIGLPGDTITMQNGRPLINGWPVPACDAGIYSYVSSGELTRGRLFVEFLGTETYLTLYVAGGQRFTGYTVQPGEVFVLGDNRNDSRDSRAWNYGYGAGLAFPAIEGRIDFVLFSVGRDGNVDLHSLLRPLGTTPHSLDGDAGELRAGIDRCLRAAPQRRSPPASL